MKTFITRHNNTFRSITITKRDTFYNFEKLENSRQGSSLKAIGKA